MCIYWGVSACNYVRQNVACTGGGYDHVLANVATTACHTIPASQENAPIGDCGRPARGGQPSYPSKKTGLTCRNLSINEPESFRRKQFPSLEVCEKGYE